MESPRQPRHQSIRVVEFADPRIELLTCDCRILPQFRWKHERLNRPFWRLYWNASSGAIISSGSQQIPLTPSTYVLLAPNTPVSTSNSRDVQHFFVHFKALSGHIDPSPRMLSVPGTPLLDHLREQALEQLLRTPVSTLHLSLYLRALIEACLASVVLKESASSCRNPRILRAVNYIEEHLDSALTNEGVAQKIGMSVSSFNRHFKREMGHPLHVYLQIRRIERACQLLQRPEYSIDRVAEEVGFCDRFYFSRVFKTHQGISPGSYRLLHQE